MYITGKQVIIDIFNCENININYDKRINDINNKINSITTKSLETKESCLFSFS
jgi:hypothetical protein